LVKLAHLTGLQAPIKFGAYRFLLNRALNHVVGLTSGQLTLVHSTLSVGEFFYNFISLTTKQFIAFTSVELR